MADGPRFDTGYTPDRKIYSDASGVNNAFISGLGNANLSPIKDITQGINAGIQTGSAILKLVDEFGPQAQERKQLELETDRARLEAAKNISTVEALKAKNAALNDGLQQAATRSELTAKNLATEEAIKNHAAVTEASAGLAQIQDKQSFDDFLKDSKYNSIRNDPAFGSAVRNKAANLLNTTNDPEEQAALVRSAEAAVPGSGKQLQGLTSTAAQALLQSPVEQAQLAKAQAPAKPDKYQVDIQKRNDRIFTSVNSALSQANIQDGETASFKVDSDGRAKIVIEPNTGEKNASRSIPVLTYDKLDPEAGAKIKAALADKIGKKDYSALQNANQQGAQQNAAQAPAYEGTGNLGEQIQPSLSPKAKTVSQLVQTPQGRTVYKMREEIVGDGENKDFDAQLSAINLYAKNSFTDYKSETVKDMARNMFKGTGMSPDMIEATANKTVAYADQIRKEEGLRYSTIAESPDVSSEYATPSDFLREQKRKVAEQKAKGNLTPEQRARDAISFTAPEKKSPEITSPSRPPSSPVKDISFVDRPSEVPSELLDAVETVESTHNTNAVGKMTKVGTAKGAYQLTDETGLRFHNILKAKDPDYDYETYNPFIKEQARQIAQAILADALRKHDGDIRKALWIYHSGTANESKLGPEGRAYAPKILAIYNQLKSKSKAVAV